MPITSDDAGIMITGDAIIVYQLHALVGKLCTEIKGIKFKHAVGRSSMAQAAAWCGSPKRTKAGVLGDFVVWMYANGLTLESQWGSIERAIGTVRTAQLKRRAERAVPKPVEGEIVMEAKCDFCGEPGAPYNAEYQGYIHPGCYRDAKRDGV